MGVFYVDCEVVNIRQPGRAVIVPRALVDSGSEFTWIPETALKQTGIRVIKKDLTFVMANGQTITRSTGYAVVRAGGFETVDEVVFGLERQIAQGSPCGLGTQRLTRLPGPLAQDNPRRPG